MWIQVSVEREHDFLVCTYKYGISRFVITNLVVFGDLTTTFTMIACSPVDQWLDSAKYFQYKAMPLETPKSDPYTQMRLFPK